MTEYMREEYEVGPRKMTPEEHYNEAMQLISGSTNVGDPMMRTAILIEALTQAMLGGLRDGLDYSARHPSSPAVAPSPPLFEEDDSRP